MSLNIRITELETRILALEAKIQDLSKNTEEKSTKPYSIVGGLAPRSLVRPADIHAGRGLLGGNQVIWNEKEIDAAYGEQPNIPKIGYNKHGHSRFSGGALIKDVTEVVEFDWKSITNKHSQGFLSPDDFPKIAVEVDEETKETIEKIGLLDLVFNPTTKTWGTPAYEIDVQKCYIVIKDEEGEIMEDSKGQQMKSLLYNEDITKTSVVWDENGNCWRFYAVYAPQPEEI